MDRISKLRMQLNYLKGARLSEAGTVKMLGLLKILAKTHAVIGLMSMVLACLADYISTRVNTIRIHGIIECCSFYFFLTGVIGLLGATSYRRGLVIAFLVMNIHAILIFVPTIIIYSGFDIHFYKHECYGECDWHLLSMPNNSRCQIFCGTNVSDNMKGFMTRLGTDYRLDAGLIALSICELIIAIISATVSSKTLCGTPKTPPMEMAPLNGATTSDSTAVQN
ncbi:hypothetical protein WR25_14948 [Diploscapter pachys]|uniref:MARVEL domain-containing protein n=1 Tax=Diploscapter pachys TaxID=2018661 RepID=A0A2A2LS70_9BILA|nr:hypothetical protein WR25_14948 [Diploscapter pachys]